MQQKKASWEVILFRTRFAGSGAHKPWLDLERSALKLFVHHTCPAMTGAPIISRT